MGLYKLSEADWLDPRPDLDVRVAAFDAHDDSVQITPAAIPAGEELAGMLDAEGGLEVAARSAWEDMCLLAPDRATGIYRLIGAAVAFPTDWCPAEKIGLPLTALHAPIGGYAKQLASGVDHFMAQLKPGPIFGRCNWFVSPTADLRWIQRESNRVAFSHVSARNAGDMLFVRCERQTLRRLPETGAILFTIGVYVTPLQTLSQRAVEWLAQALATIPPAEVERRGAASFTPQLFAWASARGLSVPARTGAARPGGDCIAGADWR
ncbi:DUF3445 domain-containing protein [Aurantiacibacter aquimixticola]|uniref:DUF3445 domain-containing protein n=2 Tax=Aurantiacibacter aquimixticola TaxID=1958945 RepID=A0A419RX75_9SPHN|nr:DUF3445 domain-containing protein [Aurantiacibacter aquimixticola]